ncbi:MAG TPA: hypothetical protein VFE51_21865, partial [Verrucomicrobiae bacterium]|nr:hypothetical protein [Verrucomicrobiae bacterium]
MQGPRIVARIVAQTFSLLYRRLLVCKTPDKYNAPALADARQTESLRYSRLKGCATALVLVVGVADAREIPQPISIANLQLVGDLSGGRAAFTLEGTAQVPDSHGGALMILRGPVALTQLPSNAKWQAKAEDAQFLIHFEHGGSFPITIKFEASVQRSNGWNRVEFGVAPSVLEAVRLKGLPPDTQLQFTGAAPPLYRNGEFRGFLPGDGQVELCWKEAPKPTEGKLFYSAEMLSQVSVSPGLLRQVALLNVKVMQGELSQVVVRLRGTGEVTRVQGDQILSWKIEPTDNPVERRLIVHLNQPQKDQFALQIQTQTAVGAFPQTVDVLQLRPESATRFGGYFRIVNEGAVRLEVTQASGLSQISPEQFPETDLTRAMLRSSDSQRFVYRFSGAEFALQIAADQILPELAVSEVLSYRLGENDLAIDGEFEVDIREAPLRELSLRVPAGYAVSQINAAGLSDHFQVEPGNQDQSELRLIFAQPISGRQVVHLRLERNKPLGESSWALPRIEILKAKSIRGHIATVADAGFRLSPERTSGLTEIANAFFPRKVASIQSAFRINEAVWQAVVRVERLSQTVQADALHLFSIGEGIAYGSTVLNYVVSGAPVSVFKVGLSDEYFNVEFTGKDVRNWQKIAGGYEVQLHTPVAGAFTLLATYERPFKPQGETLTFTGARPLDVQSEQGHTVIVSAYQFQVKAVDVSPGLLALEPGEVPSEYRLLFDAPVLAAYRYLARPFNLRLALSPLAQGDSLSLVVDRASLTTRISKEGQVLTDARYFVKNRGNPHLRLSLPKGDRLWSVSVNGSPVVPVSDANSNLIPLPHGADPNSVLTVDFKLASVAADPRHVAVMAPMVDAPLMLAEWRLAPDVGQRLVYRRGSLKPIGVSGDGSGFAQLSAALTPGKRARSLGLIGVAVACVGLGVLGLRWATGASFKFTSRHLAGLALSGLAVLTALLVLSQLADQLPVAQTEPVGELSFVAPVQQAASAMNVEVLNVEDKTSLAGQLGTAWPALLALPAWAAAAILASRARKTLAIAFGWVMAAWGALGLANGVIWFLMVTGAFVLAHLIGPLLVSWWRLPTRKHDAGLRAANPSSASAGLTILMVLSVLGGSRAAFAATPESRQGKPVGTADVVLQEIKVSDRFGYGSAKIRWEASKGQTLPLLWEPAVLTGIRYPKDALKLERTQAALEPGRTNIGTKSCWMQQIVAKRRGSIDLEVEYEVPVEESPGRRGFVLPMPSGVINRLRLTIENRDVEITSPQAVSVHSELTSSNTVGELVLSPAPWIWLEWKP